MLEIVLNEAEMAELFAQDPASEKDGGWQSLGVGLQKKTDPTTGRLKLTATDIERIKRYAGYDKGTYETRLRRTFGRTLGPNLDGSHPKI